jgi:signal transduction histidine kinase
MLPNQPYIDSITPLLSSLPNDRIKVNHLVTLAGMNTPANMELALQYLKEGVKISENINYTLGIINCLGAAAFCHSIRGDWPKAAMEVNRALPLCKNEYRYSQIYMYKCLYIITAFKGESPLKWAIRQIHHPDFATSTDYDKWPTYMQLGRGYEGINQLDSAAYYSKLLEPYVKKYAHLSPDLANNCYILVADIAFKRKEYNRALLNYRIAGNYLGRAKVFVELSQRDSVLFYSLKGLAEGQKSRIPSYVMAASTMLANYFSKSNPAEANRYLKLYIATQEEQYNAQRIKQIEEVSLTEQKAIFDLKEKEASFRRQLILLGLLTILFIFGIISFILWRNNRIRRSANEVLQRTLSDLKSTQAQLIQSEKLASLGELTAGIAHEIQNPLNFVNNFAEVSAELLDDMKADLQAGKTAEASEIADDLQVNLQKINHHGQRASAIVKGMLEHSRTSTGTKVATDISALVDEYLRLAYHGLRAKDSSFNATMETHFDPDLPKIEVIPQDIGRVLLNLINNAFYAVNQRNNAVETLHDNAVETLHAMSLPYQPTVTITTRKLENAIEISVKDNGNGIPEAIKDKIFQPFFTTKPTGQGTGLGLSLAYDIVTKGHGGSLDLESTQGQGCTFTIILPIIEPVLNR